MRQRRSVLLASILCGISLFVSACDAGDAIGGLLGAEPPDEAAPAVPAPGGELPGDEPPAGAPGGGTPDEDVPDVAVPDEQPPGQEMPGGGGGHQMDHGMLPEVDPSTLMAPNPGASTTGQIPPDTSNSGEKKIRIVCEPAKMDWIDPMVAPGDTDFWHLHTFFGNTAIAADSDLDNLSDSGNSTCGGGVSNRSSYWVPTMIDTRTNAAIEPESVITYYHTAHSRHAFEEIPDGLRLLAGDAMSTELQSEGHVSFLCHETTGESSAGIMSCPAGSDFQQIVTFPRCWDGRNVDSANHRDHMAYPTDYGHVCPETHPIMIPELKMHVHYRVPAGTDPGQHWRLSSDHDGAPAGASAHGDYVFGWDLDVAQRWFDICIIGGTDCGSAQPLS